MLWAILQTELTQSLGKGHIVDLKFDGSYRLLLCSKHHLIVAFDKTSGELAEENGATVSENRPILLRATMSDREISIVDDSTLEHNSARLVDWESLITKTGVVVSYTAIIINHGLFSLASVNYIDIATQCFFQLLILLIFEKLTVGLCDWLWNFLHYLSVCIDDSLVSYECCRGFSRVNLDVIHASTTFIWFSARLCLH